MRWLRIKSTMGGAAARSPVQVERLGVLTNN
jgi:hypothetical protein